MAWPTRCHKQAAVLLAAAMLLATGWPSALASAHILESDGPVSAVMHMPPDDNPQAGKPIDVNLSFSSTDGNFTLINYDTKLRIERDGRLLDEAEVSRKEGYEREASGEVEVAEPGAYTLVVAGTPQSAGRSFTLRYTIRVSGGENRTRPGADFWIISATAWSLLGVVAYRMVSSSGRYRDKPSGR